MVKIGALVWLPERLRNGPAVDIDPVMRTVPGRVSSVTATDWVMVAYEHWGEFGCRADELTVIGFACPRCGRQSYNPTDGVEGYCGACHDWTSPSK